MNIKKNFRKHPAISFMLLCLLLVDIEATFSFCGKRKCGGFMNPFYDEWFPYAKGQWKIFKTISAKVDTLKISSATKSESYVTSNGYGSKECSSYADTDGSVNLKTYFNIYADVSFNSSISLHFGGAYVVGSTVKDSGIVVNYNYSNYQYTTTFENNTVLNGQIFNTVQVFQFDTASYKPEIYKLWLSKNKGIIAYQRRIGKELFVLQ